MVSPNGVPAVASAYAIALHALLLGPVILLGFLLLWIIGRGGEQYSFSGMLGVEARPPQVGEPAVAPPD
jgi:hypothetical protein